LDCRATAGYANATPVAERKPVIKDVHHVGIAVRDMDVALALFRDALELPVAKEGEMAARGVRVAMLEVGASYIEIIQPVAEDSPFAQFIAERGEGLHHVALWSSDVAADLTKLRDLGVSLEDHEPRDGFTGRLSYLRPEAFDGALVEVVQPEAGLAGGSAQAGHITRIDHVVLRVPSVSDASERMEAWFGVPTKRTMDRGEQAFAFMRPGDVVIEVIGPKSGGEPRSGRIAGLALEVKGIDELTERVRAKGYPIGEPHAALQGGRIVSIHHSGACGVPVAFIDFGGSPRPGKR
jgi:methylmalonyl-CoA/ethylmalonyl-CoA epimerase